MAIDLTRCIGCAACVAACKQENATPNGIYWCNVYQKEVGVYPNASLRVLPMSCQHCENAPCVTTCPTGASYKRKDGIVLVDSEKCIGCRVCISACPYGARHFNYEGPEKDCYWGEGFGPTPFEQMKSTKHIKGTAEKCKFCAERLADGRQPACVETCVVEARTFGDIDDPNSAVARIVRDKHAKPLQEDLNTRPSVYYIGSF